MRRWFLVLGLSLAGLMALSALGGASGALPEIVDVTAAEAAQVIRENIGWPALVVMVYRPTCSRTQRVLPQIIELPAKYHDDAQVLLFAIDTGTAALARYLSAYQLPSVPLRILPWRPGEFGKACDQVGIVIGQQFGVPLLAVFDATGRVRFKSEEDSDLADLEKVVADLVD